MKKHDQPLILVTGSGGQLGKEIKRIAAEYPGYNYLFTTREELPIDDHTAVKNYFTQHKVDFCVNCAAYTAVDKAETEKDKAFLVNATAVGNLAEQCDLHQVQLIHISTDYVFDGTAGRPYKETDSPNPINVYGNSKLKGEQLAIQFNPTAIIIRSSWIYSSYGNNFVKTMLRLLKERESVNVIMDQLGCPTYAADLAAAIMHIIAGSHQPFRTDPVDPKPLIFNYANAGTTNWYEFAMIIRSFIGSECIVNPITTDQYPAMAKRPQYSVLDTSRTREVFHVTIPDWKDSLQNCLQLLMQ